MENQVQTGMNRTGAQMAPRQVKDVEAFAQERLGTARRPDMALESGSYAELHREYTHEADRIGSVPIPGTVKGAAKTAAAKMKGQKPAVLLDKLGERLAFERTGTRLYDALILKCDALAGNGAGGLLPDADALRSIRADEEAHFLLLAEAIRSLGADPTAMTPCADVAGVSGMGLMQVITDPRTTMAQALGAILTAELTDNAGWELLSELAETAGFDDLAESFAEALQAEERHLAQVKGWLRECVLEEAT